MGYPASPSRGNCIVVPGVLPNLVAAFAEQTDLRRSHPDMRLGALRGGA
jgi:hypothetical protein